MLRYTAHRLLTGLATLAALLFAYYVMTWATYTPPPCAPGSPYLVHCVALTHETQAYFDSLAQPAFDGMAIVWTLGALVLFLAVREWIGGSKTVQTVTRLFLHVCSQNSA